MDIVNPPDDVQVAGEKAPVSHRAWNKKFVAGNVVFKIVGFVEDRVPKTWKL